MQFFLIRIKGISETLSSLRQFGEFKIEINIIIPVVRFDCVLDKFSFCFSVPFAISDLQRAHMLPLSILALLTARMEMRSQEYDQRPLCTLFVDH